MTYRWLLPEHIEDLLPEAAWRLEQARRVMLDTLREAGYQLVMPPLVEFTESLDMEDAHDEREALTFRLPDPLSGRQMGIRADMTLQAARIDAHGMDHQGTNRLCYAGPVLHTRPENGSHTREPFQVGAELYGIAGVEGDLEMLGVLLRCLDALGISGFQVDVGQVELCRRLVRQAELDDGQERQLLDYLKRRDIPGLTAWSMSVPEPWRTRFRTLCALNGPAAEVLERATELYADWEDRDEVFQVLGAVAQRLGHHGALSFDLAELRGYHYHSGLVFSLYHRLFPSAIARGGRYDEIGMIFGQSRPAVGFSLDLKALLPVITKF